MGRQRRRDTVGPVLIVVGLLIGGLVFASPPVRAGTTSAVTTTDDPVGGGTASNCDLMSVSPCSLRDAVAAANATTDATISLPAGTYTVTHLAPGTLYSGLTITLSVTITGDGAATTIIQATADPVGTPASYRVLSLSGARADKGAPN